MYKTTDKCWKKLNLPHPSNNWLTAESSSKFVTSAFLSSSSSLLSHVSSRSPTIYSFSLVPFEEPLWLPPNHSPFPYGYTHCKHWTSIYPTSLVFPLLRWTQWTQLFNSEKASIKRINFGVEGWFENIPRLNIKHLLRHHKN